jgi:diguanylate cyclase (GGDEF)-like protein
MSQTVLVIDDSAVIHELLELRLQPEGLRIEHARTAEEGMKQALFVKPDVILLDLEMPEKHGFELCSMLKADPSTTMIPIIFLTATTDVLAKVKGFDLGAVDYVTKPFDVAELRARVRAALRTARYQHMLATRAQVDALTGLWNRAYFNQRIGDEVAAARRYGRAVSLCMLDLDNFKSLNDSYGHPFGDQVLQRAGEALTVTLRATDSACRYGGEEFAIILSETELDGAIVAAHRLRRALADMELRPHGEPVAVTASMGVACTSQLPGGAELTAAALIGAADDALYEAKKAGRDGIRSAKTRVAKPPA